MLKHHFEIDREGEWALDANPRVTTAEQLKGLFDLGFWRVSFGIQDIDPAVRRAINRNQTSTQSEEAFYVSKKLGYQSINFDLVYGPPLQTRVKFRKTLDAVSKMRPNRLAVYSFAHLPWMLKAHERVLREQDLPSAQEKIGLYLDTVRHFTEEGYVMIGMDHFALPGDELALALEKRTLIAILWDTPPSMAWHRSVQEFRRFPTLETVTGRIRRNLTITWNRLLNPNRKGG